MMSSHLLSMDKLTLNVILKTENTKIVENNQHFGLKNKNCYFIFRKSLQWIC